MQSAGVLYELTSTPIVIDGEQIGELKLGARFDLTRYHLGGETVLLQAGRMVESSLPRATWPSIEASSAPSAASLWPNVRSGATMRRSWFCRFKTRVWAPDFSCWPCDRWMQRYVDLPPGG